MSSTQNVGVHKSTIYLVRHGESAANVAQVNLPPHEDVLTDTGKNQADLLGCHLKDVVFTKAYASTYSRSQDTANFVLSNSGMTNKPDLKIDARIREREMGDFIGKPAKEAFAALFSAVKQGIPIIKFEIPGAETPQEYDDRIDSFVDDLFAELAIAPEPQTVLIVSHGLTILRLLLKLKDENRNLDLQSFTLANAGRPMQNTSYHVFTFQPPAPDCTDGKTCLEFLKYHQRGHLDKLETTSVDHGGPIASAFTKLQDMDYSIMSQCAQQ